MRKRKSPVIILLDLALLIVVIIAGINMVRSASIKFYKAAYPIKYIDFVKDESIRNELPQSLLYAVIRTESGFDPLAESSVGARGLMQITRDTLDWTAYRLGDGEQDFQVLYNEASNIKYGAALLRLLIDEFGSVENALCAYHAGWGNATKWLNDEKISPNGVDIANIPFGDTAGYVKKVTQTMDIYENLYDLKG